MKEIDVKIKLSEACANCELYKICIYYKKLVELLCNCENNSTLFIALSRSDITKIMADSCGYYKEIK